MDIGRPDSIVMSPGLHAVLTVLSGTDKALTGRQIGRLAELSQNGTHKLLTRLVSHGLVHEEPAGRASLYLLNREHLFVPLLIGIMRTRQRLIERLADSLAGWEVRPMHASLFGSAARGDGDLDSDLDLLVVREDDVDSDDSRWRDQLDVLARDAYAWTGNRLVCLEFSSDDVRAAVDRGERIIEEWRDAAVHLHGVDLDALLTSGSKA